MKYFENLARALFDMPYRELNEREQHVIQRIADQQPIAEDLNATFHEQLTLGQRIADKVAEFGGSWTFILSFLLIMIAWMSANALLALRSEAFDPFPFILLNLILSSLAALQAPIIMMSQNRQAAKDRMSASMNYEVSLKTDLEIIRLHQKLDAITAQLNGEQLAKGELGD